jgi:enoyl-CoA hydratase/carnithine racemase
VPLPGIVGPRVVRELMVTGEPIDAQRAYEVGLVNRVVPAGDLGDAAQAMAAGIAANAPLSVRAAKRLVYASASLGWHDALEAGDRIYEPVYLSEDAQEGPRAFKEKRAPRWSGR